MNERYLREMAKEVRKDILRAVHSAKSGHPGGSLSAADLFTYLYFAEMNIDPKNPADMERDRFVLSQRTYCAWAVCSTGRKRIFPERRSSYITACGELSSGTP